MPVARRRRQVLRLRRRRRGSVRGCGGLVRSRSLSGAVLSSDLVVIRLPVVDARVRVGQDGPRIGEGRLPVVGRATVDLVVRDRRSAVGRRRRPCEDDGGIARRRRQTLRSAGRSGGGVRRCRGFVGRTAISDAVDGGHVIVVGLAVVQTRIRIREDVAKFREERFSVLGGPSIDFVVRDRRPAVRARGGPRQVNGPVPGGCGEALRRVGRCRGRARGRRRLVGWIAVPDQVRRDDFVVVSVAIGDGDVDPTRYQPHSGQERFPTGGVSAVDEVGEERRSAIIVGRIPRQAHLAVATDRRQVPRGRRRCREQGWFDVAHCAIDPWADLRRRSKHGCNDEGNECQGRQDRRPPMAALRSCE